MLFKSQNKPFIKFCGMTRLEDIKHAVSLGVDAIGMVLVPSAARGITIDQACVLRAEIPEHIAAVVVVQNPEKSFVSQIIREVKPDYIQFHGVESPQFCEQFGVPFWKAIAVKNEISTRQLTQVFSAANAIVFDAWSPSSVGGGHGIGFNWALIPGEQKRPEQQFILAGGLSPSTLRRTAPIVRLGLIDIIDVSSGIEVQGGQKGHKSAKEMNLFLEAVRQLEL